MAQQETPLTAERGNLSLTPGTYMVEGEKQVP